MNVKQDLVGKTITAIIASPANPAVPREIWLLQFSDGTYVEFVSPAARKSLRRGATRPNIARQARHLEAAQLTLNVA